MLVPDKHRYIHSHWIIIQERILNSTIFQRKCRNNGIKVRVYTYKIQSLMITACCIKWVKSFPQQVYKKLKYVHLKTLHIFSGVLLKWIESHTKQRNLFSNKSNKEDNETLWQGKGWVDNATQWHQLPQYVKESDDHYNYKHQCQISRSRSCYGRAIGWSSLIWLAFWTGKSCRV